MSVDLQNIRLVQLNAEGFSIQYSRFNQAQLGLLSEYQLWFQLLPAPDFCLLVFLLAS